MDIRTRHVLRSVLAETLAQYPDGLPIARAYEEIEARYDFPSEWYRQIPLSSAYDELRSMGYPEWREVPQSKLIQIVATEPQWQNEMRWARNDLRKAGDLDTSAPRGVWKLTRSGLASAGSKQGLSPSEVKIATPKTPSTPTIRLDTQEDAKTESASTMKTQREVLLGTLEVLTKSMERRELELLVDIARCIRLQAIGLQEDGS